ncbi:hypothetical protein D9M68_588250 [compost metagenome]
MGEFLDISVFAGTFPMTMEPAVEKTEVSPMNASCSDNQTQAEHGGRCVDDSLSVRPISMPMSVEAEREARRWKNGTYTRSLLKASTRYRAHVQNAQTALLTRLVAKFPYTVRRLAEI